MGQYLFRRIQSIGVDHILGVPGDFNLHLLDELFKIPELKWLGTCNELNGAYAADGYARIKGTPIALVTTYAVGELSAMNGVAGAYAEHAGMIHIVGMPARAMQKARPMIHHTMEPNMDQDIYIGMSAPIRRTYTKLSNPATMAQEIDRVIEEGVKSRLPVFIYVPLDIVGIPLDATRLQTPLNTTVTNANKEQEDEIVNTTLKLIKASSNPAILADVLTIRHGGRDLTRRLVSATHFPSYSTPLSKGVIDESSPNYNGCYNGEVSFPGCAEALESSDLIVNIGPLLSDSNTGGFSRHIDDNQLVLLGHDHCQVHEKKYDGVHFLPVLKRIVEALEKEPAEYRIPRTDVFTKVETPVLNDSKSGAITQSYIWQRIGRFLKPNDIILAESGTAQFGVSDATFPSNTSYITQIFWSSIGYTVGACLGALVAASEMKNPGRVILIVGDGSLQMTAQEIGSYIRFGFTPIIFVINNNGYSIERAINGEKQTYNDISMLWDHQKMLEFFGARKDTGIDSRSVACKTVEELEAVFQDESFAAAKSIQVCEIFMDQFDYPWRLNAQLVIGRAKLRQAIQSYKE